MSATPQPPLDLPASPIRSDLGAAARRVVNAVGLGLLPIAAVGLMFVVAWREGPMAGDFHHELYPEAKLLLHGENPFPDRDTPIGGVNFVWPPVAALLVSPLTILPPKAADVVVIVAGLICFALALWLVGVRDWRVYGAVALWPPTLSEMRMSHLTPMLAVLLAGAWRWKDTRGAPGALVGVAIAVKLFVWPLGIWLAATRRAHDVLIAAVVAVSSLLLVLPFTSVPVYIDSLSRLTDVFGQESYNAYGLLMQAGAGETLARATSVVVGAGVLVAVWRLESFALAVAAALVISPIVWLDYYALAAVPLAIARPRLSAVWFVPLATWGLEGAGIGIGDVPSTMRLFVAFGIVLGVAFLGERRAGPAGGDRFASTIGVAR